jgi:hypothetical protein
LSKEKEKKGVGMEPNGTAVTNGSSRGRAKGTRKASQEKKEQVREGEWSGGVGKRE